MKKYLNKNLNKAYLNFYFLISILCFLILLSAFYFLLSDFAMAQIKLETGLPGHSTVPEQTALPSYISYLFIFGLSSIGILALSQMMLGGITYILAAGNVAKVENAKDMIFQALLGVGVLLVSYLLLRTINPDLVNLRNPNLAPTQFQGKNQEVIGGGGSSYQWATIPFNKYCADVLGKDWRDVDGSQCSSSKPTGVNACCGYFPPK